jgi:hypothetical protein
MQNLYKINNLQYILTGGSYINTNKWSNIFIHKSDDYVDAHVVVNNRIISFLCPKSDHIIELVKIEQLYDNPISTLLIDNNIRYQGRKIFEFNVIINLKNNNIPISNIAKYTQYEYINNIFLNPNKN